MVSESFTRRVTASPSLTLTTFPAIGSAADTDWIVRRSARREIFIRHINHPAVVFRYARR